MTLRHIAAALLALALLNPRPTAASEAVEALLLEAGDPPALRASLLGFAAAAPDSATGGKGAALFYAGTSFAREGRVDSAMICYERAVAVRGASAERDALVDALLHRARTGDAARALEVLEPRLRAALVTSERDIAATKARQAWALYSLGRGDSALALMRSVQRWLLDELTPHHRDWRYRLGLLELEHGDAAKSVDVLFPLALTSRFQDSDVMGILRDASRKAPQGAQLPALMKQELLQGDAAETEVLQAIGARRILFTADDGFNLAALVFAPPAGRARRAVVMVREAEEPFDACDSLGAGLARAGYAVAVLDPRGAGWSVATSCPLPDTWRDREAEMRHRVARDVSLALRALAGAVPVDTSRFLVAGTLGSAPIAVEAATLDRRARPILLLSPDPSPVDRGAMRAWLRDLATPVFFEIPVFDRRTLPLSEALYAATDPRLSRIAESEIIGSGARVFRRDITALPRLLRWLDESWSAGAPSRKRGKR